MRASGDQAKTACGNLHLCAGLEAGIEAATHALGQRRLDRLSSRQIEEEAGSSGEEEETDRVAAMMGNLRIETAGTEAEAEEVLETALNTDIEVEDGDVVEGEEGGGATQRALVS